MVAAKVLLSNLSTCCLIVTHEDCLNNPLDSSEYWQSRMPDWSKVKVPFLSACNWGGQGLHFSEGVAAGLSPQQQEIIALK